MDGHTWATALLPNRLGCDALPRSHWKTRRLAAQGLALASYAMTCKLRCVRPLRVHQSIRSPPCWRWVIHASASQTIYPVLVHLLLSSHPSIAVSRTAAQPTLANTLIARPCWDWWSKHNIEMVLRLRVLGWRASSFKLIGCLSTPARLTISNRPLHHFDRRWVVSRALERFLWLHCLAGSKLLILLFKFLVLWSMSQSNLGMNCLTFLSKSCISSWGAILFMLSFGTVIWSMWRELISRRL